MSVHDAAHVEPAVADAGPSVALTPSASKTRYKKPVSMEVKDANGSSTLLSPRTNSWVALLHSPGAGTPRTAKKLSCAKVDAAVTKAHQARLSWESRNWVEAHAERAANHQRRCEREQQRREHATQGRVRQRAGRQDMALAHQMAQGVHSQRLVHGNELRKHLDGLKQDACRQHADWAAEVEARAERLGSARCQRVATGTSHGVRRSRSADQLRKARTAHEAREDSVRIAQHLDDLRRVHSQQSRVTAGYKRLADLQGVAVARARVCERVKHIARQTHVEVHQWREGRNDYEQNYLAVARASRRDVESTRRQCAEARAADVSARLANAKVVRKDRRAAAAAWQRALLQDKATKRLLHDRIARDKLA